MLAVDTLHAMKHLHLKPYPPLALAAPPCAGNKVTERGIRAAVRLIALALWSRTTAFMVPTGIVLSTRRQAD